MMLVLFVELANFDEIRFQLYSSEVHWLLTLAIMGFLLYCWSSQQPGRIGMTYERHLGSGFTTKHTQIYHKNASKMQIMTCRYVHIPYVQACANNFPVSRPSPESFLSNCFVVIVLYRATFVV